MKVIYLTGVEIYLIALLLIIVFSIIFSVIFFKYRNRKIRDLLEEVGKSNSFFLQDTDNKIYDFELENSDYKLLIKLVYVPANSSVTINSRNTWCLRYGGSPTRGYTNMKYLKRLIPFLEYKVLEKKTRKILLIFPQTNKVQRYLNESEIAILTPGEPVYDYRVISYLEFAARFQDLL